MALNAIGLPVGGPEQDVRAGASKGQARNQPVARHEQVLDGTPQIRDRRAEGMGRRLEPCRALPPPFGQCAVGEPGAYRGLHILRLARVPEGAIESGGTDGALRLRCADGVVDGDRPGPR
jgi:hypothetical protein